MSEKRFQKMDTIIDPFPIWDTVEEKGYNCTDTLDVLVDLLNGLDDECKFLGEQRDYWESKAMTLLMQVRRLTPRMTAKEVIEFGKELEDE